jgi:hypothetical protein
MFFPNSDEGVRHMAETLDSFDFGSRRSGGRGVHPWEDYTNGEIWKIGKEDLHQASMRTFLAVLWRQARKRGKKVEYRSNKEACEIVFRVYSPEEENGETTQETQEATSKKPTTTATATVADGIKATEPKTEPAPTLTKDQRRRMARQSKRSK